MNVPDDIELKPIMQAAIIIADPYYFQKMLDKGADPSVLDYRRRTLREVLNKELDNVYEPFKGGLRANIKALDAWERDQNIVQQQ